jgi:hypothetical protein
MPAETTSVEPEEGFDHQNNLGVRVDGCPLLRQLAETAAQTQQYRMQAWWLARTLRTKVRRRRSTFGHFYTAL